jgi:hypothetical protein
MGFATNCAMELEERYDSSTSPRLRQPTVTRGVPGLCIDGIIRCDEVGHRVLSEVDGSRSLPLEAFPYVLRCPISSQFSQPYTCTQGKARLRMRGNDRPCKILNTCFAILSVKCTISFP